MILLHSKSHSRSQTWFPATQIMSDSRPWWFTSSAGRESRSLTFTNMIHVRWLRESPFELSLTHDSRSHTVLTVAVTALIYIHIYHFFFFWPIMTGRPYRQYLRRSSWLNEVITALWLCRPWIFICLYFAYCLDVKTFYTNLKLICF